MHHTTRPLRKLLPALVLAAALISLVVLAACRRGDDAVTPTVSPPPGDSPAASESAPAETPAAGEPGSEPTATLTATLTAQPAVQPPAGPRVETATITIGGRERTWRLYVPSTLPAGQAPLVIGLHGAFGSGEQFARTARFDEQAEEGGFLAAYPDGTGGFRTWNGGRCCGYAVRENVDDDAFIEAMVDAISVEYVVDPSRVYAVATRTGRSWRCAWPASPTASAPSAPLPARSK